MPLANEVEELVVRQDVAQPLYRVSPVKRGALGGVLEFADGRRFRYCSSDSNIGPGMVCVATVNERAITATFFGASTALAPVAGEGGSIGDTQVRYCLTSGVGANEYAGGFLVIQSGTGRGYTYKVKANDAAAASGGALITLYRGLAAALDNTSVGLLIASKWAGVSVLAAADYNGDQNQLIIGVSAGDFKGGTNSRTEYGWVQTRGVGAVLSASAVVKQGGVMAAGESANGSGQLPVISDNVYSYQQIGAAMVDAVNTHYCPVDICLE